MASPAAITPETMKDLQNTFKVSEETCELINQYYNKDVLPRIQKIYLAHLVLSVEEMIDEKLRKKSQENDPDEKKVRKFTITLSSDEDFKKQGARSICFANGVIIKYKPIKNTKELRIFIAHELWHLLCFYKVNKNTDAENYANLFAYFAISGKNKFYKDIVNDPDLIYPGEKDIISNIQAVCPIKEEIQKNDNPPENRVQNNV
jgi:hypothetical protein